MRNKLITLCISMLAVVGTTSLAVAYIDSYDRDWAVTASIFYVCGVASQLWRYES